MRVRWLRGPLGRELVELTGGLEPEVIARTADPAGAAASPDGVPLPDDVDRRIMHLLTEGQTNREMAEALGMSEADLAERLARRPRATRHLEPGGGNLAGVPGADPAVEHGRGRG